VPLRALRVAILAPALASALAANLGAGEPAAPPRGASRPLAVERAGRARVALPADLYPPGFGFAVVGPDGAPVAWRLLALDAGGAPRRARVSAVTEAGDGWLVTLDAGPSPPPHQGLRLPLAAAGLVQVELEQSADGRAWEPLSSASLFRLGAGEELQGAALTYPATAARYLRLRWAASPGAPRAEQFPRLTEVELEPVATAAEEVALPAAACAPDGARRTVCDLSALGDRSVASVTVSLLAGRAVGWRLRRAVDGRWLPLGEGSWEALPEPVARRVPGCEGSGPLRLELWGESEPPVPTRLVASLLPLALELDAARAGAYELRAAPGLPRPAAEAAGGGADVPWLSPGPPSELPPPPPLAVVGGGPLPKASFTRHWPVRVQAAVGEAVRLPLPGGVEATARADLGDLRLARQGRQVAFLVEGSATPERAGSWAELPLRPQGHGTSTSELRLAAGRGALVGELLLRVPARPLARDVRLVGAEARQGVGEPPPAPTPWIAWRCEPLPPLPCELAVALPAAARGPLRIEVADADNAPLAELSAELWRPRRELVFPWPGGAVVLLAGSPRLQAPAYDLAAIAENLRSRPARVARLGPALEGWEGAPARWPRWAVLASLGLAAAVLLLLLVRALPRMPQSRTSRP
jgi:hypothetical protein